MTVICILSDLLLIEEVPKLAKVPNNSNAEASSKLHAVIRTTGIFLSMPYLKFYNFNKPGMTMEGPTLLIIAPIAKPIKIGNFNKSVPNNPAAKVSQSYGASTTHNT